MTKEQEIEIQLLKDFTKIDFSNPLGWTGYYDTELKELSEAVETVLNMLKEKDREIAEQKHKKTYARQNLIFKNKQLGQLRKNNKKLKKQIYLMAEYINHLSDELVQTTGRNELEFCDGNKCCKDSEYSCEQCIKQYFENKAKE